MQLYQLIFSQNSNETIHTATLILKLQLARKTEKSGYFPEENRSAPAPLQKTC